MTLLLAFCLSLPVSVQANDSWPGPRDNPFDNPRDDWSKRFNDRTAKDDATKVEKPRKNNQLDNDWNKPRQKRQNIGGIQSRQFQQRDD